MDLKKYLAWRFVHMVITLLIVLVLLFVMFRLMPGSAAQAYIVNPQMSQFQRDQIMIRYGLSKEVPMPGDYFIGGFIAREVGHYSVTVQASDSDANTGTAVTYFDVRADAADDYGPPLISNATTEPLVPVVGSSVNVTATVSDDRSVRSVMAYIGHPDGSHTKALMNSPIGSDNYSASIANLASGVYTVEMVSLDGSNNNATAQLSFAVGGGTPDPSIYEVLASSNVITAGGSTDIFARINNPISTPRIDVSNLQGDNFTVAMTNVAGNLYRATITAADAGDYTVLVLAGGNGEALIRVRVNPVATAPPTVDGTGTLSVQNVYTFTELGTGYPYTLSPEVATGGACEIIVNATSDPWGSVSTIMATIVGPDGVSKDVAMFHPTKVVSRPMYEQFVFYMKSMLLFDFGKSFNNNKPVWDEIIAKIPATLWLFGNALIAATVIGIAIGMFVAWRRGTAFELSTIVVTLFFYSMPIFWFGLLAQWVFYVQLHWFPLSGIGGVDAFGEPLAGFSYVSDMLWHLALPLATLTVLHLAGDILLMRTAMLEVMGEDFITTAKAKGLKERTIIWKHAARNAMLPVVTSLAMAVSGVISGGVLTETIFSWPGMGSMLVRATLTQDYPMVQGAFYILAILTIVGNMAADILYAWLDPRVQL